jgi:AraC-like DNA-binding protein
VEFEPSCGIHAETGLVLHETGFLPRRPHWNYQNVFSPFWRLYFDLEPGHRVVFLKKQVTLGPGRLILIPDHQLFHTVGTQPKPKFWMHFSHDVHLTSTQPIPIELAPSVVERNLIQNVIQLLGTSKEPVNRYRVFHLSIALLHIVLSRPEIVWQSEVPANLIEVAQYIEDHYASPLYLKDLARIAHMSESAFRRKFEQFRRVAPAQFIVQVRIREAAHLLATTTLDMADIAERTGFPNPAYFSRVFKCVTGRTPAQSRRESRGLFLPGTQPPE